MSRLRLIADDLTGALDSAATFCGAYGAVPVHLHPVPDGREACAYDLACRDVPEGDAAAAARAELLAGAGIAFFKIDSLLRGHWAPMLAALWRSGRFARCVVAPAFPAQGRVTRDGRQLAMGRDGSVDVVEPDIAGRLAACGLTGAQGAEVFDATCDADLRRIVRDISTGPRGPVLWCGAAGLAAALAGVPPPPPPALPWPRLGLIGSRHPVTRAQLAPVQAWGREGPWVELGPAGAPDVAERLMRIGACVVTVAVPPEATPEHAADLIRRGLRGLLPSLPPSALLFASGGETLRAACDALGARMLHVTGPWEPGVPCSRMADGQWEGCTVVSKSGAFGDPGLLARLFAPGAD